MNFVMTSRGDGILEWGELDWGNHSHMSLL